MRRDHPYPIHRHEKTRGHAKRGELVDPASTARADGNANGGIPLENERRETGAGCNGRSAQSCGAAAGDDDIVGSHQVTGIDIKSRSTAILAPNIRVLLLSSR